MSCPSPLPVQGSPREGCIIIKKPLALFREIYYYMICAWGYSSVGERSVRIRKAVSSNLIISIKQPASSGRLLSKITSYVCSSVDRALDSGSRCAGSIPVRRAHGDMHGMSPFYVFTSGTHRRSGRHLPGKIRQVAIKLLLW